MGTLYSPGARPLQGRRELLPSAHISWHPQVYAPTEVCTGICVHVRSSSSQEGRHQPDTKGLEINKDGSTFHTGLGAWS